MTHDELRELIAPVALGAATPDEERLLDAHVGGCRECREALAGMRGAVAGLAVDVPQVEPPPSLKASLMEIVGREAGALAEPERPAPRRRRTLRLPTLRPPSRARMWPSLAAALAVAAVGLAVWGGVFRASEGPVTRTVPVVTASVSGTAEIRGGEVVLRLAGLPPIAPGRGYQVWVVRDGEDPVAAGFMAPSADGGLVAVAGDVEGAQLLAVTAEARTNTTAPTSTPLVTVALDGA